MSVIQRYCCVCNFSIKVERPNAGPNKDFEPADPILCQEHVAMYDSWRVKVGRLVGPQGIALFPMIEDLLFKLWREPQTSEQAAVTIKTKLVEIGKFPVQRSEA